MSSQIPPTFQFSTINYNPSFFQQQPILASSYVTLSYANLNYLKSVGIATSNAISTTFQNTVYLNSTLTVLGTITIGSYSTILQSGLTNGWSIGQTVSNTGTSNILLGDNTTSSFNNTVVIGNNATATVSNSVVLGSSIMTAYVPGSLSLSQPIIQAKSSYTFPLATNTLGYTFQNSYSLVIPTSNSYVTLGTLSPQLPIGVWYISYNNNLTATTIGTVSVMSLFVSNTSSNSNTPLTNLNAQQTLLSPQVFSSTTYPVVYGNNFIYNNTTPVTLYLTIFLYFTTGAYSCFGNLTCTRLA